MSPTSKIAPNRMSPIKINIGIGDSSFDESFFSFILLLSHHQDIPQPFIFRGEKNSPRQYAHTPEDLAYPIHIS
jgi:hypothetical protein